MKNKLLVALAVTSSLFFANCKSGLVTMTNGCYKAIETGKADNKNEDYNAALDQFNQVLKQCDAYDAKEQANAGKAEALNGLKQYSDALDAANAGLKANKSSLDNLFQKANAELGLKRTTDAKADFATIIDLTQKNRNTKDRATIYAKMAEIDLSQRMYTDANNNLSTALQIDPSNPDFYILQGDIYSAQKQYSDALLSYDRAINYGGNNSNVWTAKTEAEIRSFQDKYNTHDAPQLASKMSAADKNLLCGDIQKAKSNGVKQMNIDLIQAAVCK